MPREIQRDEKTSLFIEPGELGRRKDDLSRIFLEFQSATLWSCHAEAQIYQLDNF